MFILVYGKEREHTPIGVEYARIRNDSNYLINRVEGDGFIFLAMEEHHRECGCIICQGELVTNFEPDR